MKLSELPESLNKLPDSKRYTLITIIAGGFVALAIIVFGLFSASSAADAKSLDATSRAQAVAEAKKNIPVPDAAVSQALNAPLQPDAAPPAELLAQEGNKNPFTVPMPEFGGTNVPTAAPVNTAPAPIAPQPAVRTPKTPVQIAPLNRTLIAQNTKPMPEARTIDSMPEINQRLIAWQSNQRPDMETPISEAYSIREVEPLTTVSSDTKTLAIFTAQAPEKITFSVEAGAKFYDGTLVAVQPNGIIFQPDAPTGADPNAAQPTIFIAFGKNGNQPGASIQSGKQVNAQLAAPTDPAAKVALDAAPVIKSNPDPQSTGIVTVIDKRKQQQILEQLINEGQIQETIRDSRQNQVRFVDASYKASKQDGVSPCDENYVGENFHYINPQNLTFLQFVGMLQDLYKVSFLLDTDVKDEVVTLKIQKSPWNYVFQEVLRSKGLEARCGQGGLITVSPRGKSQKLDDDARKSEPTDLKVYELRYLLPTSSSPIQIAGSVGNSGTGSFSGSGGSGTSGAGGAGGGGTIEGQILQLIRGDGDARGTVVRIPNRNALAVSATARQHAEIAKLLKQLDVPGFQVIMETNYYTVQQSNATDVGGQFAAIVGNSTSTQVGGITSLPTTDGGTTTGGATTGGVNPGGISTLPGGFGQPGSDLRAVNPSALFGGSFTLGSSTFQALISLARQRGLANVQSRTTQITLDGGVTEISAGDTIIIPTTSGLNGTSGAVTINAVQSARIQPVVAVDSDGNPNAVTLNIQLTNNSINRAFAAAQPVVATQTQTGTVRLPLNETYVIGGFFVDSVTLP